MVALLASTVGCTATNTAAQGQSERQLLAQVEQYLLAQGRVARAKAGRPTLQVLREQADPQGLRHVRLQQVAGNIPVWGRELIAHFDRQGQVYRVDGDPYPLHGWTPVAPVLGRPDALAAAGAQRVGWRGTDASLYVLVESTGAPRLTYMVTITRDMERRFLFIDPYGGQVVAELEGTLSGAAPLR